MKTQSTQFSFISIFQKLCSMALAFLQLCLSCVLFPLPLCSVKTNTPSLPRIPLTTRPPSPPPGARHERPQSGRGRRSINSSSRKPSAALSINGPPVVSTRTAGLLLSLSSLWLLWLYWDIYCAAHIIRQRNRVTYIVGCVTNVEGKCTGHMARMIDNRWTFRRTEWQIRGIRSVGRPQLYWIDDIVGKPGTVWIQTAKNRESWRTLAEKWFLQS